MAKRDFHPMELALPAVFLAIAYYSLFATLTPFSTTNRSARFSYDRAQLLMKRGNFAQALTYVQDLTERFPTNHVYWTQLADLHQRLGQYEKQALALEKVMVFSSVPDEACPALGRAYDQAGERVKSLEAHRKCLSLEPQNSDFLLYAGLAEEKMGNLEQAIVNYKACIGRSAQYLDCRTGLARASLQNGDSDTGLFALTEVPEEKVRKDADALLTRAQIRIAKGQAETAYDDLKAASEVAPSYRQIWVEMGRLEEGRGRKPAAIDSYRTALKIKSEEALESRIRELEGQN